MNAQGLTLVLQQRRQLQGIALGVGQAFAASCRTGAGDQPRQGLIGFAQQAQLMQAADDFGGVLAANVRQQQALPWGEPQRCITVFLRQLGGASEHGAIEPAQRRHGADIDMTGLRLRVRANVQHV
ncbi:hypothetical protein D3C84_1025850 [compost metagenome]